MPLGLVLFSRKATQDTDRKGIAVLPNWNYWCIGGKDAFRTQHSINSVESTNFPFVPR